DLISPPGTPVHADPHWRPIIAAGDSRHAATSRDIVGALCHPDESWWGQTDSEIHHQLLKASLAHGHAGWAVALAYAAAALGIRQAGKAATSYINDAIDLAARAPLPAALFEGW